MSVISISAAVGLDATNRKRDVLNVQVMINHFKGLGKLKGYKSLALDGLCGPKTREIIAAFQIQNGLLTEEHFYNQIRPHGATIKFMNNSSSYAPALPTKSTQQTKRERIDEAIHFIRKAHGLTPSEESGYRAILGTLWEKEFSFGQDAKGNIEGAANVVKWLDFAVDVVSILRSTGASFTSGGLIGASGSLLWSVGTALGFFGPFLMFWGFVQELEKAMNTDCLIYESFGIAFGTTYWAHGGVKPLGSNQFLANWRTEAVEFRSNIDDMQYHWNRGFGHAINGLDKQCWQVQRVSAGVDFFTAKRVMRGVLSTVEKTKLTRATLKAIEKKLREKHEVNKANAVGSWTDKIRYN